MKIGIKYQVKTTQPRRHMFIGTLTGYTYDVFGKVEGYLFQLDRGKIYITKSTLKSVIIK